MAFDPDKYLSQDGSNKSAGFDPDAYLGASQEDEPSWIDTLTQYAPTPENMKNLGMGALRGATDIGETLVGWTGLTDPEATKQFFADNADQDSLAFQGGKLGAHIAGTAGVGGGVAKALRTVAPAATRLAPAIESWGMTAPRAAGASRTADAAYRVVGGAIPGGVAAGMIDPDSAGAGMAIGGAMPFVAPAAGAVADAVIKKGQQVAGGAQGQAIEWLRKTFPDNWQEVASRLKDLRQYLPGEKPTIAAAAPGFSGKLSAIEQGARATPEMADDFLRRDAANQLARMEAAQRRAEPLPGLIQARKDVSTPLYSAARGEQVPMDDTLRTIMQGPEVNRTLNAMTDSMRQGQVNAAVAGRQVQPTIASGRPAPITDYVNEWGVPTGATPQKIQIEAVERWKRAIDSELNAFNKKAPSPLGLGNVNAEQLTTARNQLTQWLNQASPKMAEARAEFAARSPQVNQAEFFSDVAGALDRPIAAEGLSQLNTMVKDLPRAFTRSTGIARYNTPEEVLGAMSPLGRRTLEGIYQSGQREVAGSQASTGAASLPKMEGVLSSIEHRVPTWFSPAITAVRNIAKRLGTDTDEAAMAMINKAALDPRAFAKLIEMTPPTERSAVMNAIRKYAAQNSQQLTTVPAVAIGAQ